MSIQSFFVPGPLPGINDYLGKDTRWKYAEDKKLWTQTIVVCIRNAKIKPLRRVWIEFCWCEPNRRRNPDNIAGIGIKFILDALYQGRILKNDGWKEIAGWRNQWTVSDKPGVMVTLKEV
jgi:hypothetical protein